MRAEVRIIAFTLTAATVNLQQHFNKKEDGQFDMLKREERVEGLRQIQ
jgi:hypothetical protein